MKVLTPHLFERTPTSSFPFLLFSFQLPALCLSPLSLFFFSSFSPIQKRQFPCPTLKGPPLGKGVQALMGPLPEESRAFPFLPGQVPVSLFRFFLYFGPGRKVPGNCEETCPWLFNRQEINFVFTVEFFNFFGTPLPLGPTTATVTPAHVPPQYLTWFMRVHKGASNVPFIFFPPSSRRSEDRRFPPTFPLPHLFFKRWPPPRRRGLIF